MLKPINDDIGSPILMTASKSIVASYRMVYIYVDLHIRVPLYRTVWSECHDIIRIKLEALDA